MTAKITSISIRTIFYLVAFLLLSGFIIDRVDAVCDRRNGVLEPIEECDDDNRIDGDGCTRDCTIEAGWRCNITVNPTTCITVCGDGILITRTEGCDDNNTISGDGCSDVCTIEPVMSPPSDSKGSGFNAAAVVVPILLILSAILITGFLIAFKRQRPEQWERMKTKAKGVIKRNPSTPKEQLKDEDRDLEASTSTGGSQGSSLPLPPSRPISALHTSPSQNSTSHLLSSSPSQSSTPIASSSPMSHGSFLDTASPPSHGSFLSLPEKATYENSSNNQSTSTSVFGTPLGMIAKTSSGIPFIVEHTINFLQAKGLKEEGLLRLAGNANEIKKLKAEYMQLGNVPQLDTYDIHVVAGVLKLFFRELPKVPLMMTKGLKEAQASDESTCVALLKEELSAIPAVNYLTLKKLFGFLHQLEKNSDINKMNANNISIVFNPALRIGSELIQFLVTRYDLVFTD